MASFLQSLLDPLPEHWSRHKDDQGREYFYNRVTLLTTYDRPGALPLGWHEHRDRATGVLYYWNEWTREVRPYEAQPSPGPSLPVVPPPPSDSSSAPEGHGHIPSPPPGPPPPCSSSSSSFGQGQSSSAGNHRTSRLSQASQASTARESTARRSSLQLGQVTAGDL
mmetsp:Transcript_43255/g.76246  ORF Transcript_43255/g.76246 Transcript_43255/m.76246 type:complete len:166 (-) Transcript_43255:341-838(-)